ncbi:MAG: energy transducer TonB, partial [Bryobacterales bacterium]
TQHQTTKLVEPSVGARPAIVLPSAPEPTPEVIQIPDPPKIETERRPEPVAADPELEIEAPRQPDLAAARSPAPGATRQGENRPRLRPNELPVLNAPKTTNEPKLPSDRQTATGLGQDGNLQLGSLRLNARPDEVIQAATENLIATGGTQIVGDGYYSQGIGGAVTPSPGNRGSTLELLSDPKGVDFRPYLIQVLAAVRRNWFAVIPESARLGMARGRVAIQFIIAKDGMVPKLVIGDSSGTPHLDRAAVAGISASVPFQPLPSEFAGEEVRLQLVFLYNVKR